MKVRIANNKNIQTMEQKDIDIYEILKDVEYGTELYTSKCGRVWFSGKAADFTQCIPYEGHENFAFTDYDFVDLPF